MSSDISDYWTISQNSSEFVAEYRRPDREITARLSGVDEETLLRRIRAWEEEQRVNGRAF